MSTHSLFVDIPPAIKAKITQYADAVEAFAFRGTQIDTDIKEQIENDYLWYRYTLEQTIATYLKRAMKK